MTDTSPKTIDVTSLTSSMRRKQYPKYMGSGFEWIGEIPEEWTVKKLKFCATINNDSLGENTEPEYELLYVDISNVDSIQGILKKEPYPFYDAPSRARRIVKDGDTIISTVRTYLRAITTLFSPEQNLIVSTGFAVVRPNLKELNSIFSSYIFNSDYFVNSVMQNSKGVSYPAINSFDLGNLKIVLPSYDEQTPIASFLDHETSRIDKLIKKKNRQIELLKEKRSALITHAVTKGLNPDAKMKDSGVEWIGEIPEHWEIKKLKYLTQFISKGTTPSTIGKELVESGKIRFIKAENILHTNQLSKMPEFYIDEETNILLKRSELLENDILIVIAGATIGKVAILTKDFLPANTNQAVCFIRFKKHPAIISYIHNYLQSDLTKILIWLTSVQSAQPNLSMENIANFITIIPPKFEQAQIVELLDKQTTKIDTLISKIQLSIDKLKEYRTALISAAVTGKIDVRNWNNEGAICQ